ncbi:MAG: hypothetical protein QG555_740 [Thermodesulfobacteriota bacterium]|nr:hypothetical protein [Thermodesulfobacteriota bacterium]
MADGWINALYSFLNRVGFIDPIHAPLVHVPMGLVIGTFVFAWTAFLTGWRGLAVSARHCLGLAFLFLFPVIIFGIIDWRHFLGGAWLVPIKMKMLLAGILVLLAAVSFVLGAKGRESSGAVLSLYTLCLITVVLLGWFGARLVYGENPLAGAAKTYERGAQVFAANCLICHVDGGNKLKPDKPLRGSPDLKDLKAFIAVIRHPEAPMPFYPESQISDKDAKELYDYIVNVINRPAAGKGEP